MADSSSRNLAYLLTHFRAVLGFNHEHRQNQTQKRLLVLLTFSGTLGFF